jgi:uncharacterized protein (UPF0332 family)
MFDWTEYITLAEALLKASDEASHRSAISRAYYAVYGIACKLKPNTVRYSGSSHIGYWNQWRGNSESRCRKLSIDANRLWKHRKDADYESVARNISHEAASAVNLAKRLVKEINELNQQGLL